MGCACCSQPSGKSAVLKSAGNKGGDFRDHYEVGQKLGEGTYGIVFDCTRKKGDTTCYAVKMLEHQSSWWGGMSKAATEQWETLSHEFEMLRIMEHPNVIKLHDVFVDRHFIYFIMDKYSSSLISSALPLLQKGRSVMPYCTIGEITAQMLCSIVYLHQQTIVHRDVKADNYLVDGSVFKSTKFLVVLTDLGTAKKLEEGVFLKDLLGTMQYWAPEVVARCYSHRVDCWAIGVILWCMLTLKFPFNTAQEAYVKTLSFRPDKMTRLQFDLIQKLLQKDPTKRSSAKESMEHEFCVDSQKKHQRMIDGGKEEDDGPEQQASGADDKNEMGFGQNKKGVDTGVAERRKQAMKDAEAEKGTWKNAQGAKGTVKKADDTDDVVAIDKQRRGEAKNYSWWSEARCKQKEVPDMNTVCTARDGKATTEDPAHEQAGDIALTEPGNVEELTSQLQNFNVDITKFGKGQAKTLDALFAELEKQECRTILRDGAVIRVVDLLALRVRTSAKLLIESEQSFADGRQRQVNRLPAVMRQAGGSGLERAKAEIRRLLKSELGTSPETVQVQLRGASQEQTSYTQDSQSYPGLTTVYRKTLFDATINTSAPGPELNKLGLPSESLFKNTAADGTCTTYKWVTEEELKKQNVTVSFPQKTLEPFEGLKPLISSNWTVPKITEVFKKHNIDASNFGVGAARSVTQFVDETNSGETRLYSDGSKLTRQLDLLVVKIKNNMGALLVETGHSFGQGQQRQKNAFPATKVRPFEDKVWAVRRLLSEVDIPYSSSKIIFGPMRVEKSESPSYPGITTVYLKQVVEVQLLQLDVGNLGGEDMGRDKWFAANEAASSSTQ